MTTRFSIGVDLGGTNLRVIAMREDGEQLETISMPTRLSAGREQVIADLCAGAETLQERHALNGECVGVGVGMPGPLELPAGILRRPPNLPGWDGMHVRKAIETRLGQAIFLNSDGNLAALAELRLGAGLSHGVDSLCMLTLGTGVGGGIVLKGHILEGMAGMAGEVGHITVVPEGALCGCGNRGCLEQYASATAIRRLTTEMAQKTPQRATASLSSACTKARNTPLCRLIAEHPEFESRDVARWADEGNAEAKAVFDEVGRCLGLALSTLVNVLNFPLYAIGGGSAAAWPLFEEAMIRELRERSYVFRATDPKLPPRDGYTPTQIVPAVLGAGSGLLGAGLFPFVGTSDVGRELATL